MHIARCDFALRKQLPAGKAVRASPFEHRCAANVARERAGTAPSLAFLPSGVHRTATWAGKMDNQRVTIAHFMSYGQDSKINNVFASRHGR